MTMSTTDHKHTVAAQAAPTITSNHPSIDQAVHQTSNDTTKPAEPSWFSSTVQDPIHNPALAAIGAMVGRYLETGSSDPAKGGGQADPLSGLAAAETTLKAKLGAFDPENNPDPTHRPGINAGPGMPSSADLQNLLASDLGVAPGSLGATSNQSGQSSSSAGGSSSHNDSRHSWLGSMLSDTVSNAGTAPVPVVTNDEGVHAVNSGNGTSNNDIKRIGDLIGTGGLSGPTRDGIQQALKEDDSNSGRTSSSGNASSANSSNTSSSSGNSSNSGSGSTTDQNKAHNGITTSHGGDGSTTVTDVNNHTATTLHPDGSTPPRACRRSPSTRH
jgi:hypothetical protein